MNNLTIYGRLGKDANLKYAGEQPVLSFSVASDVGFGERKSTNWFNCSLWGKRGQSLEPHLVKGQQVIIVGELTLRQYESNGVKGVSADVKVSEVKLVGNKPGEQKPSGGGGHGAAVTDLESDEIPF